MSSYTEENSQIPVMRQNLELLQELPFFSNLPNKALRLLAFMAERTTLSTDDLLFDEGEDHGHAYLILTGRLALLKKNGTESRLVRHFDAGDFLGSFSLLGTMPALFALRATEKTTVLTISRQQFGKILEQFPETGKLVLNALLMELHRWERQNLAESADFCINRTGATVL